MIKIGTTPIRDIRHGSTQIAKVMLGSTMIWPVSYELGLATADGTLINTSGTREITNGAAGGDITGTLRIHIRPDILTALVVSSASWLVITDATGANGHAPTIVLDANSGSSERSCQITVTPTDAAIDPVIYDFVQSAAEVTGDSTPDLTTTTYIPNPASPAAAIQYRGFSYAYTWNDPTNKHIGWSSYRQIGEDPGNNVYYVYEYTETVGLAVGWYTSSAVAPTSQISGTNVETGMMPELQVRKTVKYQDVVYTFSGMVSGGYQFVDNNTYANLFYCYRPGSAYGNACSAIGWYTDMQDNGSSVTGVTASRLSPQTTVNPDLSSSTYIPTAENLAQNIAYRGCGYGGAMDQGTYWIWSYGPNSKDPMYYLYFSPKVGGSWMMGDGQGNNIAVQLDTHVEVLSNPLDQVLAAVVKDSATLSFSGCENGCYIYFDWSTYSSLYYCYRPGRQYGNACTEIGWYTDSMDDRTATGGVTEAA